MAHLTRAYPGFCSMKRLGVSLLPPGWGRVTPSITFVSTHLYTWVDRGTVKVKCLAQEHNTMSPARARTRTAQSRNERTNHEATASYNKLLTNLANSSHTGEYWLSVVSVRTSLCSVCTATTSDQYSLVQPLRLVSKRLVLGTVAMQPYLTWEYISGIHIRSHPVIWNN